VWDNDLIGPVIRSLALLDRAYAREAARAGMVYDAALEGRVWRARARRDRRRREGAERRKAAEETGTQEVVGEEAKKDSEGNEGTQS
jgi:hypothetical protein